VHICRDAEWRNLKLSGGECFLVAARRTKELGEVHDRFA
jgi:hypothetical protein